MRITCPDQNTKSAHVLQGSSSERREAFEIRLAQRLAALLPRRGIPRGERERCEESEHGETEAGRIRKSGL